jgi:hypothetical protein
MSRRAMLYTVMIVSIFWLLSQRATTAMQQEDAIINPSVDAALNPGSIEGIVTNGISGAPLEGQETRSRCWLNSTAVAKANWKRPVGVLRASTFSGTDGKPPQTMCPGYVSFRSDAKPPPSEVKDAYLTRPISKTTSKFAIAKVSVVRNNDRGRLESLQAGHIGKEEGVRKYAALLDRPL